MIWEQIWKPFLEIRGTNRQTLTRSIPHYIVRLYSSGFFFQNIFNLSLNAFIVEWTFRKFFITTIIFLQYKEYSWTNNAAGSNVNVDICIF